MKYHWNFYLIPIAVFLLLISTHQWSDGMFLDGMIYAAISRNMAEGLGSLWKPYYTAIFNEFYEHPPLAFWLESFFFRALGDTLYAERIYSLLTYLITGGLIAVTWKRITHNPALGWLPLLFWVTIPTLSWACPNNMLENTMMVFITLGFYFYVRRTDGIHYVAAAGVCVFLAFLSKGVFALFIWSVPFWLFVFRLDKGIGAMFLRTGLLIVFTVAPGLLFALFDDGIFTNLKTYFFNQVVNSVKNVQTVSSRFTILKNVFYDLLPSILLAVITTGVGLKLRFTTTFRPVANRAWIGALLCIALSGVLPILASLKQRSFYAIDTFPFFSLAVALYLLPTLDPMLKQVTLRHRHVITGAGLAVLLIALASSYWHAGKIGRDHDELHDLYATLTLVPRGSKLSIPRSLAQQWEIYSMYARYGNITADPDNLHEFYLLRKTSNEIPRGYEKINLNTVLYDLYQKK